MVTPGQEPAGGAEEAAPRGLLCPVLVGRSAELAALCTAAQAAVAGRGSVILVMGEAGVGKTRLLRDLRAWCAPRDVSVLAGRAVDAATATPFRPLAEALFAADRVGRIRDDPEVAPFRTSLATLVPSWAEEAAHAREAPPLLHVAEGVLRVALGVARRSAAAVMLLDDLHWADAETLAVVDYLADQIPEEPILVAATARPDPHSPSVHALRRLLDRRSAVLVSLSRLGPELTIEMMRHCLADAAIPAPLLQLVQDNADGLPFFVEELLAGLATDQALVKHADGWIMRGRARERAPSTFTESVRGRFARLASPARQLLLDAAMLGRRVEAPLLCAVSASTPRQVEEALAAATDLGLLEAAEEGVRFRHALTREALVAALPAAARASRARRVLAALRGACPRLEGEWAGVAAELAEMAGEPEEAARLLLAVARHALAQGALVSAESAQRRALALVGGGPLELEVREALVVTLGLAGRPEEVFPQGEVVLARLAAPGVDPDGSRRRALHLAVARAGVAATDWALAGAHLDQLGEPDREVDPAGYARLASLRAVVALGRYDLDAADRLAAAAVTAAELAGEADLLCEALLVHGRCVRVRDLNGAAAAFQRARAVAGTAGLVHREARALTELGFVNSHRSGEVGSLHEARRLAEACGALETEAVVEVALAGAAWYRGDVEAQLAHATAAVRLGRRYRLGQLVPAATIMIAAAHAQRGDREAMEALLAETESLIGEEANELVALHAHCRGACALARDELDIAATELATAGRIAQSSYLTSVPPLVGMAPLMQALDGTDSDELISAFRARHYHLVPQVAALLGAAEAVRIGPEDPTGAADRMASALRDLAPNQFLYALVARLVAPAAAAASWGEPAAWLTEALRIFEVRGLAAAAQACRVVLRALGQRVRYGREELTARELDVLDLLAEGQSNRQIAARLFISTRTVEKHVERLLAKTGTANRAQLATHALRARLNTAAPPATTPGPGPGT